VVGHGWTLLPDGSDSHPAYYFLYAWHVPAFVVVTGYLSRRFTWSWDSLRVLLRTVVVPYLVFETLLGVFRTTVGGTDLDDWYVDPHWPMWYLAVLFLWRLATPLLNRLRHPLAVAVGISLLGGLTTGDVLDVARAAGLLPFFVLGLSLTREHLEVLSRRRVRLAAVGLMVVTGVVALLVAGPLDKEWLYWRSSYAELGVGAVDGMLLRAVALAVTGTLALAALALVPRSRRWFTPLGSASLVVYLGHGFVVKGADYAGVDDLVAQAPGPGFVVLTLAGAAVAVLLAWPPVAQRLGVLVDPIRSMEESEGPDAEPMPLSTRVEHHPELTLARHLPR
jgi:fucose 4-O-acetylase-like acetyltransferase